ncbi:hypothetical protein PIB30_039238 [Stylosanthes scabra]|uniref:Uncharacterized protein n=1 Tax=Stylosanthes scabra TaxID=79078 RepID=A0ABU6TDW9_9FABA|nr:hypothetical protein [Stylosanthes scabra]
MKRMAMDGQFSSSGAGMPEELPRNRDSWNWREVCKEILCCKFYRHYQQDMRPILPEICCKEVEEWEIEWEVIKAKYQQEATKHQQDQDIVAAEIQEKNRPKWISI